MKLNQLIRIGVFVIAIALALSTLTYRISELPVQAFDEARQAVGSIEMVDSGDWLVTTFLNKPEHWSTKPPLLYWLQSLSYKVFGVEVWSMRLPTVLAIWATCLVLVLFLGKGLQRWDIAAVTLLVLSSNSGYNGIHVAWTGDFDALLVLFITIYILTFFIWIESKKNQWGYIFFFALTGAVLTKGIAGIMLMPVLSAYALIRHEFGFFLRNSVTYIGLMLFLVLIGGYYILREQYDPGYFRAVIENEWGGRFNRALENNSQPWNFYIVNLTKERFKYWLPFSIAGCIILYMCNNISIKWKRLLLFFLITILFHLIIITAAKTKLFWYDAPIYPFMAILSATGLISIAQWTSMMFPKSIRSYITLTAIILLMSWPYIRHFRWMRATRHYALYESEWQLSAFIHRKLMNSQSVDGMAFVKSNYISESSLNFYQHIATNRKQSVRIVAPDSIYSSMGLIVADRVTREYIETHYPVQLQSQEGEIRVYRLSGINTFHN